MVVIRSVDMLTVLEIFCMLSRETIDIADDAVQERIRRQLIRLLYESVSACPTLTVKLGLLCLYMC